MAAEGLCLPTGRSAVTSRPGRRAAAGHAASAVPARERVGGCSMARCGNDGFEVTPDQLSAYAWSAPMRDLAAAVGMTDVGLRKLLVSHGVVIPGQGHWNRVRAGRPVTRRPKTPPRGPGGSDRVRLDARFAGVLSPAPPFPHDGPFASSLVPEDLEQLRAAELEALGRIPRLATCGGRIPVSHTSSGARSVGAPSPRPLRSHGTLRCSTGRWTVAGCACSTASFSRWAVVGTGLCHGAGRGARRDHQNRLCRRVDRHRDRREAPHCQARRVGSPRSRTAGLHSAAADRRSPLRPRGG